MANYKAGELTKEKILRVSRELFYRNGFENTTYVQISKKADVNLGTIIYHFKSLEGISRIIYDEIVEQRAEVIAKRIEETFPNNTINDSIKSLAQYRINTQSYLDYPNYARFVSEQLFKSEVWNTPFFDLSLGNLCHDYGISVSPKEYELHKFLFLPFAALTTSSVNSGFLDVTAKELCEYQFKTRLLSLGIDVPTQQVIFKKVDDIADAIRLTVDELMYLN